MVIVVIKKGAENNSAPYIKTMNKNILLVVVSIVAVLVGFTIGRSTAITPTLGGLVHNTQEIFSAGIKAGTSDTAVIDSSGDWTGVINTANTATLSGTNTLSGATTITGAANVSQTASSTLKIGYNASGLEYGCLVLGDSGGVTSAPVYITATGITISATTTKPAICR